jgi:hypothetical protein
MRCARFFMVGCRCAVTLMWRRGQLFATRAPFLGWDGSHTCVRPVVGVCTDALFKVLGVMTSLRRRPTRRMGERFTSLSYAGCFSLIRRGAHGRASCHVRLRWCASHDFVGVKIPLGGGQIHYCSSLSGRSISTLTGSARACILSGASARIRFARFLLSRAGTL